MQSVSEVSHAEFLQVLTPSRLRTFKVVYLALGAGISLISLMAVVLFFSSTREPDESVASLIDIMTSVNFIILILAIFVGNLLYKSRFSESNLEIKEYQSVGNQGGQVVSPSAVERCLSIIFTAGLLRIVLLEGSAFFGAVTIIVAASQGTPHTAHVYLCNLASPMVALASIALTFPTLERIQNTFQSRIQKTS